MRRRVPPAPAALALGLAIALLFPALAGLVAFAADPAPVGGRQVVAYYFHGKLRCKTCVGMEGMATAVLKTDFPAQLKDKTIEWRVVNYDDSANEHFIKDYQLVGPAIVLVELSGGKQVRYRNLEKIWQLAHEEDEFKQYVRTQLAAFLKQG
ncbi:MAG: nitrophenyl compound nitroreductase subunit ArsF family protein [Acidobacteria bacterium]|jgi:uncharacterized membrane protein|nr:nitrophenyl compound nitroreductase subunit ArsF family protein [Acidobacteriota bacterium]